ncbi:hypothetical protein PLICRDRAFT_497079 [Plicaturopsis crispa FD-325 SS-3]|nr:hypothetical protein PLICRDRAFT_497079 [Plicaturopsis crispa FD-325 SS-3]
MVMAETKRKITRNQEINATNSRASIAFLYMGHRKFSVAPVFGLLPCFRCMWTSRCRRQGWTMTAVLEDRARTTLFRRL